MPRYQVQRSSNIDAKPETVFDTVADFKTWESWSPWLIAEPTADVRVSENSNAVGATFTWSGDVTGAGELEHLRLERGQLIEVELRFIKPFQSTCRVSFMLEPDGTGTRVTWKMDGQMPWFMFWMLPMLKGFIGMDYERGLAMLKDWVETGSIPSRVKVHGSESMGPVRMAGVGGTCSVQQVGGAVKQAMEQTQQEFTRQGIVSDGPLMTVYTRFRPTRGSFDYIAGQMISDQVEVPAGSHLQTWQLGSCRVFHVQHTGSYRHLGNGWSVANQIARYRKLKQRREGAFEVYRSTPPETPEHELQTDIYLPLR